MDLERLRTAPVPVCDSRAVSSTSRQAISDRLERPVGWARAHPRSALLATLVLMVGAHLAFRAWAALGGWFYVDDYILITDARRTGLSGTALVQPYDAQFMPVGRLLAWVASLPDSISWPVLAWTSLAMQAVAAVACAWMLITLFGWRWRVLAPLAWYLTTAMTLPAFMWWAAALNQVPLQAVFFAAVACWVRYLRGVRLRWLALTLVVLGLGLLCYVKTLLVFPVLAALALVWFASGGPVQRVVTVTRRYWPAVVAGVLGAAAYLAYYVSAAPQIASADRPADAGELAGQMVGDTFFPALFGGPWRWNEQIAPVAQAATPDWGVYACWALAAVVVASLALHRERTVRAWVLLAGYVTADFVLLLVTRAQVVGSVAGTEYRYLTDAACAVVLALGLASMELDGAVGSSRPRAGSPATRRVGRRVLVVATTAVLVSGLTSSYAYARVWHTNHPGATFFRASVASVGDAERVDMAGQELPTDVTGSFFSRAGLTSVVLPLLDPAFRFPDHTADLHLLDESGRVTSAVVDAVTRSRPGPVDRCGWAVDQGGATIPLEGPTIDLAWWISIDYLASQDSGLRVRAGDDAVDVEVRRGIGTVFLQVGGAFDDVRLSGLDPGVTLCVDRVRVGQPVPFDTASLEEAR